MTMSVSASAAADNGLYRTRAKTARASSAVRPGYGSGLSSSGASARANARYLASTPRHPRRGPSTGNPGAVADAAEQEQPLVVVSAGSFIEPERRFLALAPNAHESAAGSLAPGEGRRTGRGIAGRRSAEARHRRALTTADARRLLRGASLPGNAAGS